MGKSTEGSSWTVASLLDIIAFSGLVDLRMELLLCACVAVTTAVSLLAVDKVAPLVIQFHIGTWCGSVLVAFRASSPVLVVVEKRACVTLATQSWGSSTLLCFVICQHKARILPPRIVNKHPSLFLQASNQRRNQLVGLLLPLFAVVDGATQVVGAVGKGAVRSVLHAVAADVRLVHARTRFVVAQVVASLRVTRVAM